MRISRPLIALALPVFVATACSDEYSTPDPQAPGGASGIEPGAAGMGPDTTGAGGSGTTGEPDPGMQGGINEGMNVDGPLSGGAGPGAGGSGTAAGGAPTTEPVTPVNVQGPCDIYAAGGQECVAAYSTVRRLLSTYTGPLYQIRVGSSPDNIGGLLVTNRAQAQLPNQQQGPRPQIPYTTTPQPGELVDIPQTADGFADPAIQRERCPLGTTCTVSLLYDQSGRGNHMPVAKGGQDAGGIYAKLDDFETVMDERAALTVGGHPVYSLRMEERQGYRLTTPGDGVPVDQEAQGMYMLADGTRAGNACCWDFGNVTPNPTQFSEMNTLFFGEAYWGDGNGVPPWFGADFEAGVWMGGSVEGQPGWGELNSTNRPPNPNNPSMAGVDFALGFLKTDDDADNTYVLRMANAATATNVQTAYRGAYPKLSYAGHGADNQGAIVLGVGGDNSNNSFGTFYEGAVVAGFPDDATELAVMQNIQAARYGQ
jgi:non-reducing end alpha-L-arabinofuranosidase